MHSFEDNINKYRENTYRSRPELRVASINQAVDFINSRGFAFFWPIKDHPLPSLWVAKSGDRPVPNNHDDPGHIIWQWKDSLMNQRRWYYGKILRKKATIISFSLLPNFYALSPNYGAYPHDFLEQYQQGMLSAEAKSIYESLLIEGPLDVISLRAKARLSSKENKYRFNKAIDTLQSEMKICPVGICPKGRFQYSYIMDIPARYYPDLIVQAKNITEINAAKNILSKYLSSLGGINISSIIKIFKWEKPFTKKVIEELLSENKDFSMVENEKGEDFIILNHLI
ncbi:MAG: hypothetical protein JEZ06_02160 [Anaerolineaceae bacterium]|nr:hypothetical protein [Anaerolineaceae bacterium]